MKGDKHKIVKQFLEQQEQALNTSKQQGWGSYLWDTASSAVTKSQQFLNDLGATTDAVGGVGKEEEHPQSPVILREAAVADWVKTKTPSRPIYNQDIEKLDAPFTQLKNHINNNLRKALTEYLKSTPNESLKEILNKSDYSRQKLLDIFEIAHNIPALQACVQASMAVIAVEQMLFSKVLDIAEAARSIINLEQKLTGQAVDEQLRNFQTEVQTIKSLDNAIRFEYMQKAQQSYVAKKASSREARSVKENESPIEAYDRSLSATLTPDQQKEKSRKMDEIKRKMDSSLAMLEKDLDRRLEVARDQALVTNARHIAEIKELQTELFRHNDSLGQTNKIRLAQNNARIHVLQELEAAYTSENAEAINKGIEKLRQLNDKVPFMHPEEPLVELSSEPTKKPKFLDAFEDEREAFYNPPKKTTAEALDLPASTLAMLDSYISEGRAEDYEWPERYIIAAQEEVKKEITRLEVLEATLVDRKINEPESEIIQQQLNAVVELLDAYEDDDREAILKAQEKMRSSELAVSQIQREALADVSDAFMNGVEAEREFDPEQYEQSNRALDAKLAGIKYKMKQDIKQRAEAARDRATNEDEVSITGIEPAHQALNNLKTVADRILKSASSKSELDSTEVKAFKDTLRGIDNRQFVNQESLNKIRAGLNLPELDAQLREELRNYLQVRSAIIKIEENFFSSKPNLDHARLLMDNLADIAINPEIEQELRAFQGEVLLAPRLNDAINSQHETPLHIRDRMRSGEGVADSYRLNPETQKYEAIKPVTKKAFRPTLMREGDQARSELRESFVQALEDVLVPEQHTYVAPVEIDTYDSLVKDAQRRAREENAERLQPVHQALDALAFKVTERAEKIQAVVESQGVKFDQDFEEIDGLINAKALVDYTRDLRGSEELSSLMGISLHLARMNQEIDAPTKDETRGNIELEMRPLIQKLAGQGLDNELGEFVAELNKLSVMKERPIDITKARTPSPDSERLQQEMIAKRRVTFMDEGKQNLEQIRLEEVEQNREIIEELLRRPKSNDKIAEQELELGSLLESKDDSYDDVTKSASQSPNSVDEIAEQDLERNIAKQELELGNLLEDEDEIPKSISQSPNSVTASIDMEDKPLSAEDRAVLNFELEIERQRQAQNPSKSRVPSFKPIDIKPQSLPISNNIPIKRNPKAGSSIEEQILEDKIAALELEPEPLLAQQTSVQQDDDRKAPSPLTEYVDLTKEDLDYIVEQPELSLGSVEQQDDKEIRTSENYVILEGRELFKKCLSFGVSSAGNQLNVMFKDTILKTITQNIAVGRDDITLEMLRHENDELEIPALKGEKYGDRDDEEVSEKDLAVRLAKTPMMQERKILNQKGKPAVVILKELAKHRSRSSNNFEYELDNMYGDEVDRKEAHDRLLNPQVNMTIINDIIKQASEKLEKEKAAAAKSSMFWKQIDSVTKARDGRWMINVPGRVYDIVGSMLHSVGKVVGLSQPTAAELFAQAAKEAQKMAKEALKGQVAKDRVHAKAGHSWSLGSLKAEGMETTVKKKVEKHSERTQAKHDMYETKELAKDPILSSNVQKRAQVLDMSREPLMKTDDNRRAALKKFLALEEQVKHSLEEKLDDLRIKMSIALDSSDNLNSRLQEQRLLLAKNDKGGYEYKEEARLAAQKECLKLLLSKPSLSANERGELSSLLVSEKIKTREPDLLKNLLTALSNSAEVAEMRRTLFPDSIHIGNTKIKGKADMDRVAEVMKRLDKLGVKEVQEFKDEVRKIAPSKDSWRGKALQSIGLRDRSKTKGF